MTSLKGFWYSPGLDLSNNAISGPYLQPIALHRLFTDCDPGQENRLFLKTNSSTTDWMTTKRYSADRARLGD